MSGDVSDRKRLISIKRGNLRNNHIYVSGHHDFFPKECYGPSSKKKGLGRLLTLHVEGLPDPIETDIATEGSNGTPRNFFRNRSWGRFFEKHEMREGDVIAIERTGEFAYRVYPFESKNVREGASIPDHWPAVKKRKLTTIDLFAGCGGFSVGLHRAGFRTLLAVERDSSCCATFTKNCTAGRVEAVPPGGRRHG